MNDLEELERLAAQATHLPWKVSDIDDRYILDVSGKRELARVSMRYKPYHERAEYIAAACNAVPSLIARLRGQELKNSHLSNLVEGLEEHTDILQTKVSELEKQRDFLAKCLLKQEKCFMPQAFGCSVRTPYGHYCHAESYQREACIEARAEEMAKGEWEWD